MTERSLTAPLGGGPRLWQQIVSGEANGVGSAAARVSLTGLAGLYGLAVALRRTAYGSGLIPHRELPCPVISVGNLTVGGTGKTTTTRWLARWLLKHGCQPAILSRGHRSGAGLEPRIVADARGLRLPVEASGDEPQMLGRSLSGVPVLIGRDRYRTGRIACSELEADVCVLDDGFQYWRLKKDLDLVLLNAALPFGYRRLLPRGLLREPLRALRRAQTILISHADQATPEALDEIVQLTHELAPDASVGVSRHAPLDLVSLTGDAKTPLSGLANGRWAVLSGVGHPASVEATAAAHGAADLLPLRFPDHHRYDAAEIRAVVERALKAGCRALVTTEKDAVKLKPGWFGDLPCWVMRVDLEFLSGQDEIEQLLRACVGAEPEKEVASYQTA